MNEYLAIWGESEFVIVILLFIGVIALALYFEYKYLGERKKNKEYHKRLTIINNPTTAPLKPTNNRQNIGGGKLTEESRPSNINDTSPKVPKMITKAFVINLSQFIAKIIRKCLRCVNQKRT